MRRVSQPQSKKFVLDQIKTARTMRLIVLKKRSALAKACLILKTKSATIGQNNFSRQTIPILQKPMRGRKLTSFAPIKARFWKIFVLLAESVSIKKRRTNLKFLIAVQE